MAGLARWLAASRIRRVIFIAGFFPVLGLGILSAATVIMTAQLRGPKNALLECLIAFGILALMAMLFGMDALVLLGSAGFSWLLWLSLGSLAGQSGSLTLAVQAAVIIALAGMAVFVMQVGDPAAFWLQWLERFIAEQSLDVAIDLNAQAELMTGAVVAGTLGGSLVSLLLGNAWASAVTGGASAGQFWKLRLGYVIGGLAALAGIGSLLGLQMWGLLLIFGVAFGFQGIAVTGWWAKQLKWPGGWWIGLCILPVLIPNLLVVLAMLFAALGFIDNWYGLRKRPEGA